MHEHIRQNWSWIGQRYADQEHLPYDQPRDIREDIPSLQIPHDFGCYFCGPLRWWHVRRRWHYLRGQGCQHWGKTRPIND